MQRQIRPVITAFSFLVVLALAAPALAQFDVTGEWGQRRHEDAPERGPGPALGDYAGLPVNAAAIQRADSWSSSRLTLPEYQCRPHPADYSPRGPANLRIWETVERKTQQVVSYHTHISWQAPERTIWMDGRPHPPEFAPHTWQGFSTGEWVGTSLKVTTTHLKTGFIRRNGLPRSDQAVMTEFWSRPRRLPHAYPDPRGSRLPERAVRPDHQLADESRSEADPVPLCVRGGGAHESAWCRAALPAGREPVPDRVRGQARPAA